MANDILKFKKKDKSPLYPFTNFKAVVDENGRDLDSTIQVIKEDVQCVKVKNYFDAQLDSSSGLYKVIINGPEENDKDTRYEILSVSAKNLNADDDYIVIDSNGVKGSFGDVLSLVDGADDVILYQTGGDKTKSAALYYGYDRVDFIHSKFERHCKVLQISDFISSLPAKDASGNTTFSWSGSSGNGRLQIRISSIMGVYPDLYMTLNNVQWDNKLCEVSQKNSVLSSKKGSSVNVFIDGFKNIEGETFANYSQCVNYLKQQSFKIVLKLAEPVITSIEDLGIELKSFEFERKKGESAWVEFSDPQGNTSGCIELAYLSSNDYLYTKDQIDEKFYNKSQIDASLAELAEKHDVFIARYGQTTYDDINEALGEGKTVVVKADWASGYVYFYVSDLNWDAGYIHFSAVMSEQFGDNLPGTYYCWVNDNDEWGEITHNISCLTEITWSVLKYLRDNAGLTPGMQYRITDYNTTTVQANTQAAGHQFDIIVVADDDHTLNENARAARHAGDTYFSGSTLEAWELKYDLDNDTAKYAWADATNGKGVIYWMKDEWNNECPYDFKNIQFKRYKITACINSPDLVGLYGITDNGGKYTVDSSNPYWTYTFCMIDTNDDTPHDVTVEQDAYFSDEGYCYKNHDNVFKPYYYDDYDREPILELMSLPNNCMVTDTDICCIEDEYGEFYGFYKNKFEGGCHNNTFGNTFQSNTFGNDCGNNTFGNNCGSNTFGNDCYRNTFGNDCYSNTFGNNCWNNTFGNGVYNNTFGNTFQSNTFGNNCYSNTFGNDCYSNTFGNNCNYNQFGNDCWNNTFGNNCGSNTFGNDCWNNTFGNNCNYNQFGNNCNNIIINKDYIYYIIVENGNQYITITSTQTTSSANMLRNFTIAQGVNNTSTRKTISHNTVADTFKTTYQNANSTTVDV